ncbi:MAG: nickel-dependent hydrogenase large subunit [Filomicrobium sp.]
MSRLIVGPFNRVEGDVEVKLDIVDGVVSEARVVSSLYRGFERILLGKNPDDALVYSPRICGICSVSQSVAAAHALAAAQGLDMPPNGRTAINLIHAAENVADHLTHFYLFFMPDFARKVYADEPWHAAALQRFQAIKGDASRDVLPARAQFMHLMGILTGKWPHTLGIRPGGSTRAVTANEVARISGILSAFRGFLERKLYGDDLERIISIASIDELSAWAAERPATSSDFRHYLEISSHLGLNKLGQISPLFMSYGAYGNGEAALFPRGIRDADEVRTLNAELIHEDSSHAWYVPAPKPKAPFDGATLPDIDQTDGYSWCKAPRLGGSVMEVGALARQAIAQHPLIDDLVRIGGSNVHARIVARLLEIACVVLEMQNWAWQLEPDESFCDHGTMPRDAIGVGLTEAARGSLGHWLKVENGKIANYQIIAPTTWNFSPRDSENKPGALEQALEGAPVRPGETEPIAVQHVVRSFDPCLVCTVH